MSQYYTNNKKTVALTYQGPPAVLTEGSPSELRHHSISQENGKSHKTVKKQ